MVVPPTQKTKAKKKNFRHRRMTAWIKSHVSTSDHCPGKFDRAAGKIIPKGRITNAQAMAQINREEFRRYPSLTNIEIGRNCTGQEVQYASGNIARDHDNLACIDVDCHGRGTPQDAFDFLAHVETEVLRQKIFQENSTNKGGGYGYVLINRQGENSAAVNDGLLSLELLLERVRRNGRFDGTPWNITGVEVRGRCSKTQWDAEGRCIGYTAGSLMRLPQTFLDSPEREAGLRNTARLSLTQMGLTHTPYSPWPLVDYVGEKAKSSAPPPPTKRSGVGEYPTPDLQCPEDREYRRSTRNHPIKRREIERIDSTYANVAAKYFPVTLRCHGLLSRHICTREDQAIYLCVQGHCTSTQGDNKAMPSKRIYTIWLAMWKEGSVSRAPDHARIAAMRNHLSKTGQIDWYSHEFWTPDKVRFKADKPCKGICCKYSLAKELMVELGFPTSPGARETIASTTSETLQYPPILSLFSDGGVPSEDFIRPQRVGWASHYYGVAA
jgi:hypothetical protein